ncbi:MAG TPA: altronate dehydratase family protein [Terracidiphilus sp.]|jgi:altronate hydrolase|nr:altronate dehydratase family protein [Terracidiphilus sp.]
MPDAVLQIDTRDNVLVALAALNVGSDVRYGHPPAACPVTEAIPAKHKMALQDFAPGDLIRMYGMVVGEATQAIPRGGLISTRNLRHRADQYTAERKPAHFALPDASRWTGRTFDGFLRADGQVGTRNYWLVLPMVFCENRNVERIREALEEELGYAGEGNRYRQRVRELVQGRSGGNGHGVAEAVAAAHAERVFPNLDGIRFLTHQGGCGGTRQDAQALCGLLAGYIHHPNVAGATVLSLGCQHAQASMLMDEYRARDPKMTKPVLVFEHQRSGRDSVLMTEALEATFAALEEANAAHRAPAPLADITIGLQCGGSDGFSGISANPTLGYVSDLLAELGGKTLLSEFPELHGVEQELVNRCATDELAARFYNLMHAYAARAHAVQSGFEMNPSPGNIADGLITDAIKSAGAARKGGAGPIRGVLDYPEYVTEPGLNLHCTPGNDVESVTAQVGSGANLVLFTTGLGTPTGNPIAPVVKISTNSALAARMPDNIDFDAGGIIGGETTIPECAEKLLELGIEVASGRMHTKAELLKQNDFIPWKRGVSL